jgi:hypothetical protein
MTALFDIGVIRHCEATADLALDAWLDTDAVGQWRLAAMAPLSSS